MPVPGPRTQFAPDPGYRNPDQEWPTRLQHWLRPAAMVSPGRSPGTMVRELRGHVLGAGQIRRMWRQSIDLIAPQASYSWTESSPGPGRPRTVEAGGFGLTRALRYMTRSVYAGQGIDNTRHEGLHSVVRPRARGKPPTLGAGVRRSPPTVRNRITSFGSRVAPVNAPARAADRG